MIANPNYNYGHYIPGDNYSGWKYIYWEDGIDSEGKIITEDEWNSLVKDSITVLQQDNGWDK